MGLWVKKKKEIYFSLVFTLMYYTGVQRAEQTCRQQNFFKQNFLQGFTLTKPHVLQDTKVLKQYFTLKQSWQASMLI